MKPFLTEKTYLLANAASKPVFTLLVSQETTTAQIKVWVKSVYKVDVTGVRFTSTAGKSFKRKGIKGRTTGRRKALVSLKAGQRLPEFEIQTEKEAKAEAKKEARTAKESKQ